MSCCRIALALSFLLVASAVGVGCDLIPTEFEKKDELVQHRDGNAEVDVAAAQKARDEAIGASRAGAIPKGPMITSLSFGPKEVRVTDSLEARAELSAGSSRFADIDYTWFINDHRVSGVTRGRLDPKTGRYQKGDRVHVVATASDETGLSFSKKADPIRILNSSPEVVTNVKYLRGLNGVKLDAIDPDDDELTWSITAGPPGISIDRRGRIRVEAVRLKEAFDGEVVFAASDPDGARGELHVPLTMTAAQEDRRDEKQVTYRKTRANSTDSEIADATDREVEAISKMTAAEFEAHIAAQEKAKRDREQGQD